MHRDLKSVEQGRGASESRRDHGKMNVSSCPHRSGHVTMSEATNERQRLDEYVASLMVQIQESEAKMVCINQENETHQGTMRAIRQEKDDTIKQRKKVDEQLQSLNNEITDKRDVLMRLQGNLQYRKEEKINEAIRRLEYQLVANNYKVTEEIKIVHEIDRLKRSKKSLCQYLALKEELDRTKDKLNTMRNERDALYRRVATFKSGEEETKNNVRENRASSDALRKEIDELHTKKRKAIADLKLASQPLLHLRELHQPAHRRTPCFTKKQPVSEEASYNQQPAAAATPSTRNANEQSAAPSRFAFPSHDASTFHRKGFSRRSPTTPQDPQADQMRLCTLLSTYLLRMTNLTMTPASTPALTPVVERPTPSEDFFDGDWITVLNKRAQCDDARAQKFRSLKKNKKEKKSHFSKALSHTPEVLLQFDTLGLKPPSIVGDIQACLDKLSAKKESLTVEIAKTPEEEVAAPQCDRRDVPSCSNSIASLSPLKTIESTDGDVTDAPLDSGLSSEVDTVPLMSASTSLLTNSTDDSTTRNEQPRGREHENRLTSTSCRSLTPPPLSPPKIVVTGYDIDDEDKILNVAGLKLMEPPTKCSAAELNSALMTTSSNDVSFSLNITGACNGTLINGDGAELAAL